MYGGGKYIYIFHCTCIFRKCNYTWHLFYCTCTVKKKLSMRAFDSTCLNKNDMYLHKPYISHVTIKVWIRNVSQHTPTRFPEAIIKWGQPNTTNKVSKSYIWGRPFFYYIWGRPNIIPVVDGINYAKLWCSGALRSGSPQDRVFGIRNPIRWSETSLGLVLFYGICFPQRAGKRNPTINMEWHPVACQRTPQHLRL